MKDREKDTKTERKTQRQRERHKDRDTEEHACAHGHGCSAFVGDHYSTTILATIRPVPHCAICREGKQVRDHKVIDVKRVDRSGDFQQQGAGERSGAFHSVYLY